jgi:hypothetical protein
MLKTEISVLEETSEDYKVNYLRPLQCAIQTYKIDFLVF